MASPKDPSVHPKSALAPERTSHAASSRARDVARLDFVARPTRLSAIKPNAQNARTRSKKQIAQIAASIREFETSAGRRPNTLGRTAAAIERIAIGSLQPWGKNARVHSSKQIRQLARGIETLGFINPVLIDLENRILAGHGRFAAACPSSELLGQPSR